MPDLMDYHLDGSGLIDEFQVAMRSVYQQVKGETGYDAIRFLQMVTKHGAFEAARQLLKQKEPSDGLTELWQEDRLNLSMEYMILDRKWRPLFTREELQVAVDRLHELEADPLLREVGGVSFEDNRPVLDY